MLRPDARPEMGHQHGQLCEWRWLLPLQLLSCQGSGSDYTRRYLRARMPTHCRGSTTWRIPLTGKAEKDEDHENVVSEVGLWVMSCQLQNSTLYRPCFSLDLNLPISQTAIVLSCYICLSFFLPSRIQNAFYHSLRRLKSSLRTITKTQLEALHLGCATWN